MARVGMSDLERLKFDILHNYYFYGVYDESVDADDVLEAYDKI